MARTDPQHPAGRPAFSITPMAIQGKEFRVRRFGGYRMQDVDEFLDELTEQVSAMQAEIERLRARPPSPVVGTPDLDDVGRQADEIIARARAEAARITAVARASAGSPRRREATRSAPSSCRSEASSAISPSSSRRTRGR